MIWYVARGSGLVTLVLLTVVVALGVGARSGRTPFGLPRFAVNLLHRNAALLAVSFLTVHVVTLLFDPYAQVRLVDLVLPFAGAYRPVWVGLGTVALDLVVALIVTSLLRHRLGVRAWRAVHWLAYLCWPVALLHGLGTGTDNSTWWLWTVSLACAATVAVAAIWRLSAGFEAFPRRAPRRLRSESLLVRSGPVRSGPVRSDPVRSGPERSDVGRSDLARSGLVRPDVVRAELQESR